VRQGLVTTNFPASVQQDIRAQQEGEVIVPRSYYRAKIYDCLKSLALVEGIILVLTGIIYWFAGIEPTDAPRIMQVIGVITILLAFLSGFGWQASGICSEESVTISNSVSDKGIHGSLRQDFYSGSLAVLLLGFGIGMLNILLGEIILMLI
jgi:hypothetical protein